MLKRVVHKLGLVEDTKKDYKKKNKPKGSKASSELSSRSRDLFVKIKHVGGQKELYKHAVPVSKLMRKHHGMCIALPEVFKDPHNAVLNEGEVLQPGHKYILISFKDVDKLKRKLPVQGKTIRPNGVVAAVEKMDKKARSPSGQRLKAPEGVAGQKTHDEITFSKENGNMKMSNGVAGQERLETRTSGKCNKGQAKVANGLVDEEGEIVDTMVDGSQGGDVEEQSLFSSARDFYVPKEKAPARPYSRRKGLKGKSPFVPPLPKGRSYRSMGWQPSLPTVKELSP
ncbi:hypothetical protein PIB30_012582 [Stylosanthes scabra]|uniref:Uncharacterized protein n=1 Tax=Stylosanthes scabra TaxID=79078 RepID=A0ABU6W487_9FABA|nr:hypothetical protein [Stylosanthes scabra]